MNDDLNLKLSQLVDEELAKDESIKVLNLAHEQAEMHAKLRRYAMISSVIKSESLTHTDVDFVSKVSQKVMQEPVILAPAWHRLVWQPSKPSVQAWSAIAASIAIVAIFALGVVNVTPDQPLAPALTVAKTATPQPVINIQQLQASTEAANLTVASKAGDSKVDPRFIEYLEAHDNSLYAAGSPGAQSYVRVVSYGQK